MTSPPRRKSQSPAVWVHSARRRASAPAFWASSAKRRLMPSAMAKLVRVAPATPSSRSLPKSSVAHSRVVHFVSSFRYSSSARTRST